MNQPRGSGKTIDKIGIVAKVHAPESPQLVPELVLWLKKRGMQVLTEPRTAELKLSGVQIVETERLAQMVDLLIVLGGDGTLIGAARAVKHPTTPLLAVNLGNLGFLTVVTLPDLYGAISRVLAGDYHISHRFLLDVEHHPLQGSMRRYRVLNDAVITKTALSRMIHLETLVNGHFLTRYQADGLIVATPTGSTAYSLAAGGPILFPTTEAIVLSPICPHQLTNRSVVFPSDVMIDVVVAEAQDEMTLTLDGQIGVSLSAEDRVRVTRSRHSVGLVVFPETDFFQVWRKKLHWGRR